MKVCNAVSDSKGSAGSYPPWGLEKREQIMHVCGRPGFRGLSAADIRGWIVLCGGGCPGHYRTSGSIPGAYSLGDSTSLTPAVTTQNVSRQCQMSPGAKSPLAETHCLCTDKESCPQHLRKERYRIAHT